MSVPPAANSPVFLRCRVVLRDPGSMSVSQRFDPSHRDSSPGPDGVRPGSGRLLLMVGLPGAGKTTRAKELAAAHRALRLTPDEWMIQLFGRPQPGGKRDI